MKTAFVSPYINNTNQYIELQKSLLTACLYEVKPLNIKTIFSKELIELLKPNNILVFHWLETRPFKWKSSKLIFSVFGFLVFLLYILIIIFSKAKSVYFVHNHAVHDTEKLNRKLSIFLIKILLKISDYRIVHDPMYTLDYNANYLPIPLYDDNKTLATLTRKQKNDSQCIIYGILGAIRPYKAIHEILENWPNGHRLLIRGKAIESYDKLLKKIIEENNQHLFIDYQEGFLEVSEFESAVGNIDAFILPHAAGSMLVSGAFFEVIGKVKFLIGRRTPFLSWVQTEFKGIYLFENAKQIKDIVKKIESNDYHYSYLNENKAKAIKLFGFEQCTNSYREFLRIIESH